MTFRQLRWSSDFYQIQFNTDKRKREKKKRFHLYHLGLLHSKQPPNGWLKTINIYQVMVLKVGNLIWAPLGICQLLLPRLTNAAPVCWQISWQLTQTLEQLGHIYPASNWLLQIYSHHSCVPKATKKGVHRRLCSRSNKKRHVPISKNFPCLCMCHIHKCLISHSKSYDQAQIPEKSQTPLLGRRMTVTLQRAKL